MILSLVEVLMMSLQILRAAHFQFPHGDFPVYERTLFYLPSRAIVIASSDDERTERDGLG